MLRFWIFAFFSLCSATVFADSRQLLDSLDAVIENRAQFINSKEERIAYLKKKTKTETDADAILRAIDDLYSEYYVFRFDSAISYANKGLELATKYNNVRYTHLFRIHRAEILAIGGFYSEAIQQLDSVTLPSEEQQLLFKRDYTYFQVYSYWSDYSKGQSFSQHYRQMANNHLRQAMQYTDDSDPLLKFYQGEQNVYVEHDSKKARDFYLNILKTTDCDSRIFAMASYALAGNYRMAGDEERYAEYLIKAALSDLRSCTMENTALQSLAIYLFEKDDSQIERAERYIKLSMEDAMFYNNRLRILEISRIMPQIMTSYQSVMKKQNRNLRNSVIFISLLVIGLLGTAYFIYRQNRKLTARRRELANSNLQLHDLNEQLAESNRHQADLNEQLQGLNQRLVDTNKRREGLASIYIDLCARYIDKLGKYQTLVKRKIRANQAQELLQTISSTRVSEEDAATFLHRFDKAFLELYPTFVEEFNNLLYENERIKQKLPHSLTTELRTFALIRLGVKNTADIAGLLCLSTQTIYNCRSVIKSKAISKDSFDDDVLKLCTVISI